MSIKNLILSLLLIPIVADAQNLPVTRVGIVDECPYFCEGEKYRNGYIRELLDEFFNIHSVNKVQYFALPPFRISQMVETGQLEYGVLNSKDVRYNSKLNSFDSVLGVSYSGVVSDVKSNYLVLSKADLEGEAVCFVNLPPSLREIFLNLHSKSPTKVISIKGRDSVGRGFRMLQTQRTRILIGEYNSLSHHLGKYPELSEDYKVSASSFTGYNSLVLFTASSNKSYKELNGSFTRYIDNKRESRELRVLMDSYYIDDWSQQVTY